MEAATTSPRAESARTTLFMYASAAILALLLGCAALRIWELDLNTPFNYNGDAFLSLVWVKSVVDTGWWTTNDYLGAPGQLEMGDFPFNPSLHMAVIRVLTLVIGRPALLLNLYFLLSFPAIAVAAVAALRALGISRWGAVVAAVLYSLLPYHFWRGEAHLVLACYYMVPLVVLVLAWLWHASPFLIVRRPSGRLGLEVRSRRALASLLVCALMGFDVPYYPLFAGLFLLGTGLATYFIKGSGITLLRSGLLVAVMAAAFTVNVTPNLVYRVEHGRNPSPTHEAAHPWEQVEMFSLKIAPMLVPAANHPIKAFRQLRDKYYASTPVPSEGDSMALGTLGALGLLLLLGRHLLAYRATTERGQMCMLLALLTVGAILIGTTGGLVTMLSLAGFSLARAYNRLSIFLGLFSLAALFAALDSLQERFAPAGWRAWSARGALLGLLLLGFFDQTRMNYVAWTHQVPGQGDHSAGFRNLRAEFDSDRTFVQEIEAVVPPGTKVFQLPYVSFLSTATGDARIEPCSHFRGYIHSHTLKWSFGAMTGRPDDRLQAALVAKPLPESVEDLARLGFGGIYIDRWGYVDSGARLEADLCRLLATGPLVSPNGRLAFYDMSALLRKRAGACSEGEWQRREYVATYQPPITVRSGFFPEEQDQGRRWRWCGATGELEILNSTESTQRVCLTFLAATYQADDAQLRIQGLGLDDRLVLNARGSRHTATFELPPGRHVLTFTCNAQPFVHPSRTLVFSVCNLDCHLRPE